jgi:hypothetical protein
VRLGARRLGESVADADRQRGAGQQQQASGQGMSHGGSFLRRDGEGRIAC